MKNKAPPVLSVILVNYNFGQYILDCLQSIDKSKLNAPIEIIVADNNSTDTSYADCQNLKLINPLISYKFTQNNGNLGFSKGNNLGLKISDPASQYVLFLNPDTTVELDTFQKMIQYFEDNHQVDAATCYINFALTGSLQPESHRGFPTPLNTFWHFFGFGLPKLFPKSKFFNGYFLGHLDLTKPVEIEACVGAFIMVKRSVGNTIGWWSEKYFMYGEDLDFCYQLKKHGFKLFFYPYTRITHYQGVASGIKTSSQQLLRKKVTQASRDTKIRSARATTNAMRVFYENNLMDQYTVYLHPLINLGINFLEFYRVFKAKFL